jgi:hypothetical protein
MFDSNSSGTSRAGCLKDFLRQLFFKKLTSYFTASLKELTSIIYGRTAVSFRKT